MARAKCLLDEALDAWRYVRGGVLDELAHLPAREFGYRPTPHSRSVAELALHIVESGLMAAGELTRPDGDFTRQDYPAFIAEYAGNRLDVKGKAPIVALLEATLDEGLGAFRRAGELALLQHIVQFNGEPATRLTWFHHAIAHEEYHRGQLALYARLVGHVPALTRKIAGS